MLKSKNNQSQIRLLLPYEIFNIVVSKVLMREREREREREWGASTCVEESQICNSKMR